MKQALLEAWLLSQSPETIHSRRDESNTVAKEGNTGEHSSKTHKEDLGRDSGNGNCNEYALQEITNRDDPHDHCNKEFIVDLAPQLTHTMHADDSNTLDVILMHPEILVAPAQSNLTIKNRNQFDLLNTENELQKAFDNLQGNKPNQYATISHCNLALVTTDGVTSYLSDGAGTKDDPNLGVEFLTSAPNSDGDPDFEPGENIRPRRSRRTMNARKKGTGTGKEKTQPHHTVT